MTACIGTLDVGLAPGAAETLAEIIEHQIDLAIIGKGSSYRGRARHHAKLHTRY